MHVILHFTVVPLDAGGSVAPYVAACLDVLDERGLSYELHANGTDVEGTWEEVFGALRECQEAVHARGARRVFVTAQWSTRTDRMGTMRRKVDRVEAVRRSGERTSPK